MTAFLKPILAAHCVWLANELQTLPHFRGEIAAGAWANDHGLTVGYLSWNLDHDLAADTIDLVLAVSLQSRTSKKAVVTLDLAWSDGWLIAQFLDQSLSSDSPEVLRSEIDALITSRRAEVISLMAQALDGRL